MIEKVHRKKESCSSLKRNSSGDKYSCLKPVTLFTPLVDILYFCQKVPVPSHLNVAFLNNCYPLILDVIICSENPFSSQTLKK